MHGVPSGHGHHRGRPAFVTAVPEVHYALSGGVSIAYQVFGSGPLDIVICRSGVGHLELMWEHPKVAQLLEHVGSFGRTMVFDAQGFGLSDLGDPAHVGKWEGTVDNGVAVMDAVGSTRAVVVGFGAAVTGTLMFAATRPERLSSLVLVNGTARVTSTDDYPWGIPESARRRVLERLASNEWPPPWEEPGMPGWLGRYFRASASPAVWRAMYEAAPDFDVRHVLDAVRMRTLCIAGTEDRSTPDPVGASVDLASRIDGATVREVETTGSSMFLAFARPDLIANEIQRFVTGAVPPVSTDRVLAAVLFTDIVGSTEATASAGDARWRHSLDALDDVVTIEAERFGGRVVKSTGDGHLLTFAAPSRAIQCGQAIRDRAAAELDLRLRSGVHIGEVERRGEDIAGMAVVIARRVCDLADAGELLVSHAVPPLVVGGGDSFEHRGARKLKGVPDKWTVYEVV